MSHDAQRWDAKAYAENAGFVPALAGEALAWLAPRAGERILDLGCGDGVLSARLAEAGAVVVGVDASADMVAAARGRGVDAHLVDGAALSYDAAFDAVFSNAALHWMTDPDAVARGVARALRPGGRFVGEFGGHGNVAAIATAARACLMRRGAAPDALPRPWYFPTPVGYEAVLARAGFEMLRAELAPRPTPLPTGIEGWLAVMAQPFLQGLDEAARAAAIADIAALLEPALKREDGVWTADYVRLRFEARLKPKT